MHPFTEIYEAKAVPALTSAQEYPSAYLVPKVEKVSLNIGTGSAIARGKNADEFEKVLAAISGQKPVTRLARKSVAGFKLRAGMPVGMTVTLRGTKMRDFMIKFAQVDLPRTRDFRGLKASGIAADGSLHIGIRDAAIFPEAADLPFAAGQGLQVSIVTTPCTREEARRLYNALGFIFQP